MNDISANFSGEIPKNYERYLGDFIFEPFAINLAGRAIAHQPVNVLELACGTGRLTNHLLKDLPRDGVLTATDINPAMLAVAQEKVLGANIYWETVDISSLPYEDEQFDLVICQFGLMFVPDRENSLRGIKRVLKKKGKLLFSAWGRLSDNPAWKINNSVLESYLNSSILTGPFSMADEKAVLSILAKVGFSYADVDEVKLIGESKTASDAAKGFLMGLPVYSVVTNKNPELLYPIWDALSEALAQNLGDNPLRTTLTAWVFEAIN